MAKRIEDFIEIQLDNTEIVNLKYMYQYVQVLCGWINQQIR